ncbi:MAG: hypothetical protein EA359_11355 [Balneolaceae bacterium]|nr:MAG: hypothetical protein EA359_11355 [Balneolaceae bacterium]
MKMNFRLLLLTIFLLFGFGWQLSSAQGTQVFRLGEGMVRIAEPGQLADTLAVWGDVSNSGRYIVPRGTTPHELISYARGITRTGIGTGGGDQVQLDWSKRRVEINISTFNKQTGIETVERFTYRFNEPYPTALRTYQLRNDQIITVEVKRSATILDYVRFVAPITTFIASTYFLIERLSD